MTSPLSGTQHELVSGAYTATIASVGASLRALRHSGRDLVVPFDADEVRPAFRGATLAPWPNRVVDGRYTFGGVEHELALTEPRRGHALHGLVAWTSFDVVESSATSVTLSTTIEAQVGYPHRVLVTVEYVLSSTGLRETVTADNQGRDAAPFGTGPHPYLVAGPGRVDDWTLSLDAAQVLAVTEERLIPVSLVDIGDTEFDFRTPRVIGDTFIDHAFTGLGGSATLTVADGSGVVMQWDAACPWLQVHTADRPIPAENRLGLAVEPMTCPPDAFNSGTDLVILEPGDTTSASWTISALLP
ncbi:galactose mutarotase [Glaciihabitans arcticus]|uniref:Galactose mutarotase n=1 Tax=Glaciihabitans arcticus TaxID=2668039 RepID=A0A4Q9GRH4_9MICO|nr:aldose 1-epimerase family protein [Glaciihabitans arcticus]TBN57542.1 galactose mutarotase [Glaciihabitans arcticus]